MAYVILAIVGIVILVAAFVIIRGKVRFHRFIDNNIIIYGQKGSGKTTACALACRYFDRKATRYRKWHKRKFRGYVSNTDFGYPSGQTILPDEITVEPNTWEGVLHGDIEPIIKNPNFEKKPVILDDAGIYLPNFADSSLKKEYPSLPIAFAVWRHLYDAPILINSQDLERTWKMLREQQAVYIYCRGVVKLPFFIGVKYTIYDRYEAARTMRNPMGSRILNKYSKAEVDKFKAENGRILKGIYFARTKTLHFDSRYFHNVFFQLPAPKFKRPKLFKKKP